MLVLISIHTRARATFLVLSLLKIIKRTSNLSAHPPTPAPLAYNPCNNSSSCQISVILTLDSLVYVQMLSDGYVPPTIVFRRVVCAQNFRDLLCCLVTQSLSVCFVKLSYFSSSPVRKQLILSLTVVRSSVSQTFFFHDPFIKILLLRDPIQFVSPIHACR